MQQASGMDLCSVKSWTFVCKELQKAYKSLDGVRVNAYKGPGGAITYGDIKTLITSTMEYLLRGRDSLSGSDYCTHLVRCGATLAMYLSGTPIVEIMLQGRWSSDAFLLYIKRQVLELSAGVSANMVECDEFSILPRRNNTVPLHRTKSSLAYSSPRRRDRTTSPRLHLSH